MTGGLNRYEQEAKPNQMTEGLDVVNQDGDLRRRDAFGAFAMGAPHMLPAGMTYVKVYDYSLQSWTDYSSRNPDFSTIGAGGGLDNRLFIGCDEQFQGIDVGQMDRTTASAINVASYPQIRFVTSDWSDSSSPAADTGLYESAPWVGDTTDDRSDTKAYYQSLMQSGHIWWHKNSQPSDWDTKRTVDGVSAYWIIVDSFSSKAYSDTAYAARFSPRAGQSLAPGIRCFKLNPVNALVTTKNRGASRYLVATQSRETRGQETGGPQLGAIYSPAYPTYYVGLEKDEGSAFQGTYDTSGWTDTGWTGGSIGPGTDLVEKRDQSYDWMNSIVSGSVRTHRGSWGYPVLMTGIQTTGTPTTTSFTFPTDLATNPNLRGSGVPKDTEFEDCVCVCTATGTGGPTAGRANRIKTCTVSGDDVTLTFAAAWDNTPAADSVFMIFGIGHRCALYYDAYNDSADDLSGTTVGQRQTWYEISHTDATSAHQLQIAPGGPDANFIGDRMDPDNYSGKDGPVFFSVVRESRYELPENISFDSTFDEVTRDYIFAFGDYYLQRFDGKVMKKLQALSDPNDLVVQNWTGFITEQFAGEIDDPGFQKNAFLRSEPPKGKYVQAFANRIFVAGIPGDPSRVVYSAPGAYNDLWPKGYESLVRDPLGSPITGMDVLNNELVVYTNNSVYAAQAPNQDGYFNLQPRSQGLGFVNHNVVQRAVFGGSAVLIGANADGIYAYTGAEPIIILDEWDRLLEGGINQATMGRSCAAISYYENCYYIAVPGQNSEYPNRLIRYCWTDKTFYVFTAPFGGITAIETDRDESGNEFLVFGHEDGTISTFIDNWTDDGETITGYARTPIIKAGGNVISPSGYMVTVRDMGEDVVQTDNHLTFKEFLDQDEGNETTVHTGAFSGGSAAVSSMEIDTDKVAGRKNVTRKIMSKSGTRAREVQLQIEGVGRWRLRNLEAIITGKGQGIK